MIKDTDPERIGKLVGSMRESVRVLNEIRAMNEGLIRKCVTVTA